MLCSKRPVSNDYKYGGLKEVVWVLKTEELYIISCGFKSLCRKPEVNLKV